MSRPAAEEQFLEQNPWANPQHPIHQRHMGRLSRQVSDQTQIADTVITPAAQKSLVDLNKPADSASTIPEHPSAQASSALNTPHSNHRSIRPQKSEGARTTGDQQRPLGFEKPQQQKERFQSVSPTEARKHTLAIYDPTPSKTNSTGPKDVELEEPPSHSYKMSRISLFGSPVRPDPLSRNGSSNAEMATGHATSSPITLHPHGRENHITPATGLSRIGAR